MQDSTHSISKSAVRFFSGTMVSRITGMLRDIALAYAFGTQSAVAALMVAFRFAHLLRRLFGEGALQTAFIPHFEQLRKDDPQKANRFFCDLTASLTHFLMIVIGITCIVLGFFIVFETLSPGNAEIVWLTLLMMPSLLFICLFGINASLLQCEKSYFIPSAAPAAFNLVWIIGILLISYFELPHPMSWLAFFVILACFAQWAITLPKTLFILKGQQDSPWKHYKIYSRDVKSLVIPLALGITGVAASQVNNALDAIFARWASDEGPALLWYAIRLQQMPLALFGIAISGALLPPLARAIKNHDNTKFHHFLDFAINRTIALMLPITGALLVMGDTAIHLIYGHGDFGNTSTAQTTQALWGYTLGLIPMTLTLVLAPAFYAKSDYRTPSIASVASVIVNIALNTVMIAIFNLGAASVAVATSASALVNLTWLAFVLSRTQGEIITANFWKNTIKIGLATVIAGFAVLGLDVMIWNQSTGIEILQGIIPDYNLNIFSQLARFCMQATTFTVVLFAIAYLIKANELLDLISKKGWSKAKA